MTYTTKIIETLQSLGNSEIVYHSKRFFKTGVGEYGEGDQFLGIRVPIVRQQVRKFNQCSLEDSLVLLANPYHEVRLFAVLKLVELYQTAPIVLKNKIYTSYLENSHWVNSWDLVDSSAHKIVGSHLLKLSKRPLFQLAKSDLIWDRRIAMIACYHFIEKDAFDDALKLAQLLLNDPHDLIQKAVGWMLREVGKRDLEREVFFLNLYYRQMPRTMLRYAIEKFPPELRLEYLNGRV